MDIQKFVALFAEQFDSTAPELFTPALKFRDLEEWDSLAALSIIAMVDEEYEIRITGADIRGTSTIEELFNIISTKKS